MRDVWKSFDEKTQNEHLPCKTSVHRHFSTSFGLHIAVITADGMFIFTSRAKRGWFIIDCIIEILFSLRFLHITAFVWYHRTECECLPGNVKMSFR